MTAPLLTAQQVADMLQITVRTLHAWRKTGRGPLAVVDGKWVRYRPSDVEAYIESQQNREAS